MSRNLRRLIGNNTLPPPDSDDSAGEYDPVPHRSKKEKSIYAGLEVSSSDENEPEGTPPLETVQLDSDGEVLEPPQGVVKKKHPRKRNGKKKKNAASHQGAAAAGSSSNQLTQRRSRDFDIIEQYIREVNAMTPPAPSQDLSANEMQIILAIQPKHLNVCNELDRLLGPEEPADVRTRVATQPRRARILKRVSVTPLASTVIYDFTKTGLSMSIDKREPGLIYFVFEHHEEYQKVHQTFLDRYARHLGHSPSLAGEVDLEQARRKMHCEGLLVITDKLFGMDEHSLANEIVENVVTYLQFVAHPWFNLSRTDIRLQYTYFENRPFHVVMLKYLYLLSNKACHRTALEIAKMLLNLDPSDPLAVLFIIDTMALRAREFQWLIDFIDLFSRTREADKMFNIQYSLALAHFHVAVKNKKDLNVADELLRQAIVATPPIVLKILQYANITEPKIQTHTLYTREPISPSCDGMHQLMMVYAKLNWVRFREPHVRDWFLRNAIDITHTYDNDEEFQMRARNLTIHRHVQYQEWPPEIIRHIAVIRSMSNLLLDTKIPELNVQTYSWDPLFDEGINRYNYKLHSLPKHIRRPDNVSLLFRFFNSIVPVENYELELDEDDLAQLGRQNFD